MTAKVGNALHHAGCGCRHPGWRRTSTDLASRHLRHDHNIDMEHAVEQLAELTGWPLARHVASTLYLPLLWPQWAGRLTAGVMVLSGSAIFSGMRPEWLILPVWTASWTLPLWLGGRIVRRRRNTVGYTSDDARVLRAVGERRGGRAINQHFEELPASIMTHPLSARYVAKARELDEETIETASALALDYHGGLAELLRTAKML